MNKILKRLLGGAISASIVIGTLVTPIFAEGDPVLSITFDETGTLPYTLHGGTIAAGKFDNALSLASASEQYADINDASAINALNGDFTFNIWVKPTSLDVWARAFDIGTSSSAYMFLCPSPWQNEGHPRFAIKLSDGTEQNMDADDAISTGEWSMITVVRDGSSTKMYINGKLSGTSTAITAKPSDLGATTNNYLGKSQFPDPYFNGMIDNFDVYNYALTDSKIAQAYAEATVADTNRLEIDTKFYTNDKRSFEVDGNNVKVNVPSSNEKDANIIAAAYDGDVLSNVVIADTSKLIAGMNKVTLENVKKKETDTVRVYVWDSASGMKPVPDISVNNVFQISEGSSVTVKTNVTNSTTTAKSLVFDVTAYDAQGQAFEKIMLDIPSHHKTLNVLESAEFTETVTGSADVAYYKVEVIDVTDGSNAVTYDAGYLPTANVSFPDASPQDTFATTFAAHDPTIFKDPKTGVYYAYNSGNALVGEYTDDNGNKQSDDADIDCFKSTDLIHWQRIDCGFRNPESAITHLNTIFSGRVSQPNDQSWAPDILYRPDDKEHPYWMYYSLSTNGPKDTEGDRFAYTRSLIGLVKGATPEGPWTDCGVVISSEENYNTNAIDSNIYTDTNGDRFFIWGSYQKGIHQLKLRDDGLAEGIDYTSIQTIHSSSKTGTRLYSTPNGTQGPEGPWMLNNTDTGYRYMFVSCGWLASTYNIRVARNSLSKTWASETSSSAHHKLLDYKGRKVGTTFTEQTDKSELWGYKMIGSYQLGDGITYYGNGHNSVLHDDDDNWYLVEHCRKQNGGYANLQVRKMLWTADGWPVVSPLVYAGEDEQKIPMQMLAGTWDLSSVGHTILDSSISSVGSGSDEKVDLPVRSSQIILALDNGVYKTDGTPIGTWTYDDDHTVTIEFEQDGDGDNYEFYQDGDTMTLYALTGYDKDKRESAVVMTGIDQNGITQFAKKNNAVDYPTKTINKINTTPTTVAKSTGGNPIVGMESTTPTYGGDPSVLVDGDTVYLYAGHDTATTEDYIIPEYICYSSKDLKTWTLHGSVFKVNRTTVPWASGDTSAWAGQVLKHNGTYYLYFCTWGSSTYSGYQCIGVATSDSPTGPFTNVSQTPLINGLTMTTENVHAWDDIDPTGWIETDEGGTEHIYLNWGNVENYTCELNSDMISVKDQNNDNQITSADIVHTTFNNMTGTYTEAPYLYRRTDSEGNYTGKYYLFFAQDIREQWGYATTDNIMGGSWDYGNLMMQPTATSNTSHGAVFDFKGKTYFVYHNGSLPGGSGYRRVANIQEVTFNDDGTIDTMEEMSTGLSGTRSTIVTTSNKFLAHESFANPLDNSSYPLKKQLVFGGVLTGSAFNDMQWEIVAGKADPANENYVSIQSVNKPGLYICVSGTSVILTQMDTNTKSLARKMTFKTVKAINNHEGYVSFESVAKPGYFLTASDTTLTLTAGEDKDACTFLIDPEVAASDPNNN